MTLQGQKGNIFLHGNIIAENVTIIFTRLIYPTKDSLGEWRGKHNAGWLDMFLMNTCVLKLESGHFGAVILTSSEDFIGAGPLNKPLSS